MKKNEIFVQVRIDTNADLITNHIIDMQAFKGDYLDRKYAGRVVEQNLQGIVTVTMPVEITTKKRRLKK